MLRSSAKSLDITPPSSHPDLGNFPRGLPTCTGGRGCAGSFRLAPLHALRVQHPQVAVAVRDRATPKMIRYLPPNRRLWG